MKLGIIGTGYVGLPQGAAFADNGNKVICVDCLEERINDIKGFCEGKKENLPLYESGLNEIVKRNYKAGNLDFTTNLDKAVQDSDILFICVGTPSNDNGSVDRKYVFGAVEDIAKAMNYADGIHKSVVIKSTVIPGTANHARGIMLKNTHNSFDIISNPEFLAQGVALEDCRKPSRIVIGIPAHKYGTPEGNYIQETFNELYKPFALSNTEKIFYMTNEDAELHKYAANTMLAAQISVTNELAKLAREVGANWRRASRPLRYDKRIGRFIHPSPGFGGSCFPKDVKAIAKIFNDKNVEAKVISNIIPSNEDQKLTLNRRLEENFNIEGKTYAIWGLSFKAETNDTRESAAIEIISDLLNRGAKVRAYDPEAVSDMQHKLEEKGLEPGLLENITYFEPSKNNSKYEAVKGSDGLFVLTEWSEFRQPDFHELKKLLNTPLILDGRDIYSPENMDKLGFNYICIGNPDVIKR